jgi:hypothetical protein
MESSKENAGKREVLFLMITQSSFQVRHKRRFSFSKGA